MTNLILMRDKNTGKTAMYPESHLRLFPNMECVETEAPCTDCVFQPEPEDEDDEILLTEPTPRKRTKK